MATNQTLQLRVHGIRLEAEGVISLTLRPVSPLLQLPDYSPGSHIDLHLRNGLIRSYSLLHRIGEVNCYSVAINREPNSRGGSSYLHESLRVGDVINISHPRNNFPVNESARHSIFIAGGIGITPFLSMISRLEEIGRSWELHYAARTRDRAAFLDRISALDALGDPRVFLAFSEETEGRTLNLSDIAARIRPSDHIYCCGPPRMMEAFGAVTAMMPSETVHVEFFKAQEGPDTAGGFKLRLAKSDKLIVVPAGKSILDALLEVGIKVPYACREGVCGTCEVRVLDGLPRHRDLFLSKDEKASNNVMMSCCSGSKSDVLVLDL